MPKITGSITRRLCARCSHKWTPRLKRKPRICPRCKSKRHDDPIKKAK